MPAKLPNKSFEVEFSDDDHIDLSMTEGHINVSKGKEEWRQANKIGLIGQEGDWRFDPEEGLPWVDNGTLPPGRESIMNGQVSESLIEIYIYQQLLREPRNASVDNVNVRFDDRSTRSIVGSADVKSVDGELIEVEV